MKLHRTIKENKLILTVASIEEALSKSNDVTLHPRLGNALLIYDDVHKNKLAELYHSFLSLAHKAKLPILILTPTWRANYERLLEANISKNVNGDAVSFLENLTAAFGKFKDNILIAGDISCKNDAYLPAEALSKKEARKFHKWQIDQLCEHQIDLLTAGPLPAVSEATGIALAMEGKGIPYILNFVINRSGSILDGTSLKRAFEKIDASCNEPPLGYMIGCSYPSFLNASKQPNSVISRLIGFQANASSLNHSELDEAVEKHSDDISDWGPRMIELNKRFGIKILGGCCGTRLEHLQYIIDNMHSEHSAARDGAKNRATPE
jgi:S-methylmethionine-dependent homocysteine/selenocysteine methylase